MAAFAYERCLRCDRKPLASDVASAAYSASVFSGGRPFCEQCLAASPVVGAALIADRQRFLFSLRLNLQGLDMTEIDASLDALCPDGWANDWSAYAQQ